jgi:hypothetical protein
MTERIAYNMWQREELYPGKLNGSCNYTGYGEFDNLTGYLTKEYTTEWQDSSGTRWRKTCRIINLGRPDRGVPVDSDEAMTPEPLEVSKATHASIVARAEQRAGRDAALVERVRACIKKHGAMSATALGGRLKVARERAARVLNDNPSVFRPLGWNDKSWGLVGVEYKEKRTIHKGVNEARDYLLKHGPSTAPDVSRAMGHVGNSMSHLFKHHPDLFCVVSIRPASGRISPTPVWGVVGVHDAA